MSSDSEMENLTPPDVSEIVEAAKNNLLPAKSEGRYKFVYQKFMEWRLKNDIKSFSENVMIAYFQELSNTLKPTSLWSFYSMLKATININHNMDIANYSKLQALLKRKSDGFKCKKSKILTSKNINDFLQNAPDDKYLFMKVAFIIGISGACRKQELRNIKPSNVQDTGKNLVINIPDSRTKRQRSFVVSEYFYPRVKKYINLRSAVNGASNLSFFLNYVNGKCTRHCVGINRLGQVPKQIAIYLGLPEAATYTGHCFRRSSASILGDAGGDLLALKRHCGWQSSTVAEGWLEQQARQLLLQVSEGNNSSTIEPGTSNQVEVTNSILQSDFEGHAVKIEDDSEALSCGETSNITEPLLLLQTSENLEIDTLSSDFDGHAVKIEDDSEALSCGETSNITDPLLLLKTSEYLQTDDAGNICPEQSHTSPVTFENCQKKPDTVYCRLCLKKTKRYTCLPLGEINLNYPNKGDAFKAKKREKIEEIQTMINICLPFYESLTFNPMFCCTCVRKLVTCFDFVDQCKQSQKLIESYVNTCDASEMVDIDEVIESNVGIETHPEEAKSVRQSLIVRSSQPVGRKRSIPTETKTTDRPIVKRQKIEVQTLEELTEQNSEINVKEEPIYSYLYSPGISDSTLTDPLIKVESDYTDSPSYVETTESEIGVLPFKTENTVNVTVAESNVFHGNEIRQGGSQKSDIEREGEMNYLFLDPGEDLSSRGSMTKSSYINVPTSGNIQSVLDNN